MNELRGPPSLPPFASVPGANGAVHFPTGTAATAATNPRRSVRMMKRAGEGSFGMTLEQDPNATLNDFPRVSYVFPNSAAWRAGVCSGWTIEAINGENCRGRLVRDVAPMFRDLEDVTLYVDVRTETVAVLPMPSLVGAQYLSTASVFVPPPQQQRGLLGPGPTHRHPAHSTAAVVPMASSPATVANGRMAIHSNNNTHPNGVSVHRSTTATAGVSPMVTASTSASNTAPSTTRPTLVVAQRPSTTSAAAASAAVSSAPSPLGTPTAMSAARPLPPTSTHVAAAQAASAAPDTATEPTRAPGKKRARSQSDQTMAASATATVTAAAAAAPAPAPEPGNGKKRARSQKRRQSAPPPAVTTSSFIMDISEAGDEDYSGFVYCSDEDDVEEVSPPPASSRRTSSRQAESGGRVRRSLTVSRLMAMNFNQEEAELSVQACGQDPDKCMLWIVAYREEQQFMNDLNQASIASENQRRLDAEQQDRQELETLRQTTAFASLFPTSYILNDLANAPRLREMLSSTIGEIAADTLMRTLMTKLLTVESKAIRWYKDACKCYMLELAARLEAAFASHDVIACCATLMATQSATEACAFVQALQEEEQALTQALFFMPENQGGVPLAFLRADESMQFSLDDDGFEVVDQAPSSEASPGQDDGTEEKMEM